MRFRLLKRPPKAGTNLVHAELQVQRELGWSVCGILHMNAAEWEVLVERIGIEVVEARESRP